MNGGTVILSKEHLNALRESTAVINKLQLELGLVKRGFNHLWGEISLQYPVTGAVEIDFETGVLTSVETQEVKNQQAGKQEVGHG